MAKTTAQSSLIAKLKQRSKGAWSDARDTEAKPGGFTNLPGGIRNGVGRVISTDFKESEDKGKGAHPVASIRFVTREPLDYEGVQQTIFYNFKDTEKRTIADVLATFASDLQLLGIVTADTSEDDIPRLLEELATAKPYFLFNTSQGRATKDFPTPQTFVNPQGLAVNYVPPDGDDEPVAEEPAAATPTPKKGPVKAPPKKAPPKAPPKAPKPAPAEEVVEEEVVSEDTIVDETDSWVPKPEENYYAVVSGTKTVVEVVKVDEDAKTVNVKVVDDEHPMNGKVVKKNWADLTGE